jgi:hypothetical protein
MASVPPARAELSKPHSPIVAHAASVTVPLHEPVYRDLDRLDALGLLPDEVLNHRPLSRGEIARIVEKASRRPEAILAPAKELLVALRRDYPTRRLGEDRGFQGIAFGVAGTNSAPERIHRENGIGSVDGVVHPLAGYREGSPFAEGGTAWIQTEHSHYPGRRFAIGARTDVRLFVGDDTFDEGPDAISRSSIDVDADVSLKALYGRFRFGGLIVQVGRDALSWGPTPSGGLLLSNNARPLDMVLVTHESSYRLPWIFRHLGPQRIGFALADLGTDRVHPNSFLLASRGTFRLHRRIELGVWDTLILGGDGAPKPALFEILHEIFPYGRRGTDEDLSDHRIAFDLRLHVVPGHLLLYHEAFLDDGFRPAPLGDMWDVMSFRSGFYLPAIGREGRFDLRGEVTRIPAIAYRHGRWRTGYALDDRLLGDELGPDARGVRIDTAWLRRDGNRLGLELAWEGRDADDWAQEPASEPGTFGDIFRVLDRPTQSRVRARVGLDWNVEAGVKWQPRLGVERVVNPHFRKGDDAVTNVLIEIGLRIDFSKRGR